MTEIIAISSGLVTLVAGFPYIYDVLKKKTHPRIVSWFMWGLIGLIGAFASSSENHLSATVLSGTSAVVCFLIFILGLKTGLKEIEKLDILSFFGSITGVGLWIFFDSPSLAVVSVIIADFIATIPTIKHGFQKPEEETIATFILAGLGGLLATLSAKSFAVTAIANPIYIAVINATVVSSIVLGRKKRGVIGISGDNLN